MRLKNGTKIYTRGPALKNIKKLMVLCLAAVVCCGLYDTRVEAAGTMWNAPIFSRLFLTTGIVGKEIEGDEDDDIKIHLMAVDETKQDCICADTDEEAAVMWSNEDVEVKIDVQSKSETTTDLFCLQTWLLSRLLWFLSSTSRSSLMPFWRR